MDTEIKGKDGVLQIYSGGGGSRSGDFYVVVRAEGEFLVPEVCVRLPGPIGGGGGMHGKTHLALNQLFHAASKPSRKRSRAEMPDGEVVLSGDDLSGSGEFPYLRMRRDAGGYTLETRQVSALVTSGGEVHFDPSPELDALYEAVRLDAKQMAQRLRHAMEEKSGPFYEGLDARAWEDADKNYRMGTNPPAGFEEYTVKSEQLPEHRENCYATLRERGLFMLRAGVPLPEETHARWMQEFGNELGVQQVIAAQAASAVKKK